MKFNCLEKFILDEEQAANYIMYALEFIYGWENISYIKDPELNEWTFSGYINYEGKQKIIRIIDIKHCWKFLKLGLELKKNYPIDYVEVRENKDNTCSFIVSYYLINNYARERKML